MSGQHRNATTTPASIDDIDAYVAALSEKDREELATAEAAIDIAILLHRAREQRGLTQACAASLAGLHQQAVSRLERAGSRPNLDTLQTYLAALGYGLELHVIDLATGEPAFTMPLPAKAPDRAG